MELHSKLGGYLGFIKGLLVVALVLFIMGALPAGYLEKKRRLEAQVEGSWTVSLAKLINPFPKLTFFDDLSAYQRLLKDPEAVARLKEQPAFQKLRQHPAVREALAEPEVARKLEQRDYRFLLAEPKVARLLRDREVRRLLIELDPRKALEVPAPSLDVARDGELVEPPALEEPSPGEPRTGPAVLEPETIRPAEEQEELVLPDEASQPQGVPGQGRIPIAPPEQSARETPGPDEQEHLTE